MAISKLVLNGEVQMDVTSDTVTAGSMLSGTTATKNDGTKATGTIASKSSTDMTVSGATVTAPAGYYANAASKAVATTTHPNPSASITSSTGVVTASHTQGTGYVTGGTTTGTLNLTTQAGKTVTPTESAQTAVASYRWTTGNVNVAAISSTYVGTGVTTRSAANLTASGSVVTAPAGYYSTAATKAVAAGSAFPPAVTITKAPTIGVNTSGVVTASYSGSSSITPTVTSGYVSQGTAGTISTTGTSTYQLTSKAAATYYPSTADQTIASQRWLVGAQTIKSVTTSNLTAANIAEGVTVKVGDSSNASRITQVTGTHSGSPSYTATIRTYESFGASGNANYCYVSYNGTKYYTLGNTFTFKEGDILTVRAYNSFYINGANTDFDISSGFNWVLPGSDIDIYFLYENASDSTVHIRILDLPSDSICFYAHWDNQTESVYYTCNKTYEQCFEILEAANGVDVIAYGDTPYDTRTSYTSVLVHNDSGYFLRFRNYRYEASDGVHSQISYYPDGTIEYLDYPVSIITQIDITSNGTYTNSSRYYKTINVSVQGSGGFTADEIAMRTISGKISGNATLISDYAFYTFPSLTTVSFPSCSLIGGYAFAYCFSLTTVSFPSCSEIGSYAFYNCRSLTTVNFPAAQSIYGSAFRYCYSLTTANFPSCSVIGSYAFYSCRSLTTASFPAAQSIYGSAFGYCYNLVSLYLLGSSVVSLMSINAFNSTPISTYTTSTGGVHGSVFIPASLYNEYITATNWSVYSDRFVSV